MILFKPQFFMVCMLIKKNNYPYLSVASNLACHSLAFLKAKPSQSKHQHPTRVVLWSLPIMQHYYSFPEPTRTLKQTQLSWLVMTSTHTLHSFLLSDFPSIQAQVYAPQQSFFLWYFFLNVDHFKSLYRTCFNAASVFCFSFCASGHMGSYLPDQGSNPHPLHLEAEVLTTGPPGRSQHCLLTTFFP